MVVRTPSLVYIYFSIVSRSLHQWELRSFFFLSLSTWYQSQGKKPNSFLFPVSSTPGNLPVTVFHSGHLPHLPILSGQSDRRQKTLTAGKIFQRRLFPTPTIPEGAPGGDLQLLWRHRNQKIIHAPATRNFPSDDCIAWGLSRPRTSSSSLAWRRLAFLHPWFCHPSPARTSFGVFCLRRPSKQFFRRASPTFSPS